MKRFAAAALVLHFSLFALHSPAASPAATQSWVKNYVSTAGVGRVAIDVSPVEFHVVNDEGEAETVTFTFERADRRAMRVEDSNVSGMTNGTLFAENGEYAYVNTDNSACTGFSGAMERVGWMMLGGHYEYTTNGAEIASNIVYFASNEVRELRFVLDVRGEVFTSRLMKNGRHKCTSASNPSRTFFLRSCTITDREWTALATPRASFCLWRLLVPAAVAAVAGEKEVYKSERVGDWVYDYWRQHSYTDAAEASLSVRCGEVTVSSGGQAKVFDLSDVWLLRIEAGVDFCDLKDSQSLTEDELYDVVKERFGPGRAVQMKSSTAWTDLLGKLIEAAELERDILGSECPTEGRDERFEPLYEPHTCGDWVGECGNWRCGYAACTNVVAAVEGDSDHPADHDFRITEEGGSCAICVHCGARPEDEEQHHGWHDGVTASGVGRIVLESHVCACACGKFVLPHQPKAQTVRFVEDLRNPNTCWEVWECLRCGEVMEPDSYDSVDGLHDGGYTISAGGHNEAHNGKYTAVTVENPHTGEAVDVCRCTYTCRHFRNLVDLGCGAVRTEDFEHLPKEEAALATRPLDETYHEIAVPCGNGFISWNNTTNWCGYTFYTNEEHRIGFSEVLPWDDPDYPATRTHHAFLKVCGHRNMSEELKIDPRNHECGMEIVTNQTHAFIGASSYGDPDATTHAVSNYCYKCNGTFLAYPDGREQHVPTKGAATYSYVDMASHIVTNVCARCDATYVVDDGLEPHEPEYRDGEIVRSCAYLTETEHVVSNYCRKCESWFLAEIEEHVPKYENPAPEDEYVRCKPLADWTHETFVPCERCMKPTTNGLEYVWIMLGTNECSKAWRLGEATNSADVVYCEFERHGCDNSTSTNHAWNAENDLFHWCENGGGHLNGGHIYPEYVAGAKCTVCGHEYVPPPPSCEYCECTEPRGQNYICTSWDHELQRCNCNHCDNMAEGYDDGELCYCERSLVVDNITYWLTKRSGGKAEILRFYGDDGRAEGDVVIPDSVEKDGAKYTVTTICEDRHAADIDEDSLITSISAGENLTSIEKGGLHGHFQMASASFPGVTTIGDNAFLGCTALTNVFIPAVTSVGEFAFKYDHSIRSMECPEMVTIGTNAFGYSWGITNACFPKATHIAPGAFDSAGEIHLHLGQTVVTCETGAENFAAIHFPSNKTLNGVVYPAESIYFGGGYVPIVWEAPAQ